MLTRLVLTDFRNHADLTIAPGVGFVVLTGENGAGKTNVLEAVSLLAPGRGLRRAMLSAMARRDGTRNEGPRGFGVAATLGDDTALATGTQVAAPERRIVRVNGAIANAAALAERVTILWLTPTMDRLFVDGAGDRRRFLDRLVLALFPGHAVHSARYEAAMRARNRLLAEDAPDGDWLSALEVRMTEHGVAIDAARRETVALLAGVLEGQPSGVFPCATIGLAGEAVPDDLASILRRGRARDAAAGRTLAGPHRTDLVVTHVDKEQPASLASTGEQKALLLGVMMAHAELVSERVGRAPVLLLDEVAAHLDPVRRAGLFARLQGRGQVWMTGTEEALFAEAGEATRVRIAR